MTLSRLIATGRGKMPRVRLEIEGLSVQPVTHRSMEKSLSDGRSRVVGLRLDGVRIGARLDLAEGTIDGDGFTARMVDTKRSASMVAAFRQSPTRRTFLTGSHSRSATTLNVFATNIFPTSGTLHIGTEVVTYTGKTSTTFTGCTRGAWGTQAQAHAAADGASLSYPHVTDHPISIEGRRAVLYLYGEGDDPQGDGTARWRGVVATDATIRGREVTFHVDPPTAILRQQLGGDTVDPVPIRGIYYPWNAPFWLALTRQSAAARGSSATTDFGVVKVRGFFETQREFCDELNSQISALIGAWTLGTGASLTAQPIEGGFRITYVAGTGTVYWIHPETLNRDISAVQEHPAGGGSEWFNNSGGGSVFSVAAGGTYRIDFVAPVPRAVFGRRTPHQALELPRGTRYTSPTDAASLPSSRLYLGGLSPVSTDSFVGLEGDEEGVYRGVRSVVAASRIVDVDLGAARIDEEPTALFLGPTTLVRLGRKFTEGNVGDLMQWLVANSPDLANSGVCPLVTSGDVSITGAELRAVTRTPVTEGRTFAAFGQAVSLADILNSHLAAAGMHPSLTTAGQITARVARLAASTELGVAHVYGTDTGTQRAVGAIPQVDQSGWGHVSDVRVSTGYSPIEDEFDGPTAHMRNVQASAPLRAARSKLIEQRSVSSRYGSIFTVPTGALVELTPDELARVAEPWLGLLGDAYDLITVEVPATMLDVTLGDVVLLTHPMVPSRSTGAFGVAGLPGILVGFDWELESMKGTLTLLCHARNVAGYAPGFEVTSEALVGGTQWDLTLGTASDYLEAGQTVSQWLATGNDVNIIERDSTTPTTVSGTIDSVSGTVVRVTLTGAWTPGGGTGQWDLTLQASDNYDAADDESRFVFVGGTLGVSHSDATVTHRTFGP